MFFKEVPANRVARTAALLASLLVNNLGSELSHKPLLNCEAGKREPTGLFHTWRDDRTVQFKHINSNLWLSIISIVLDL